MRRFADSNFSEAFVREVHQHRITRLSKTLIIQSAKLQDMQSSEAWEVFLSLRVDLQSSRAPNETKSAFSCFVSYN